LRQTRRLLWLACGFFLGATVGVLAQAQGGAANGSWLVDGRAITGGLIAGIPLAIALWKTFDLKVITDNSAQKESSKAIVAEVEAIKKSVEGHGERLARIEGLAATLTQLLAEAPWRVSKG